MASVLLLLAGQGAFQVALVREVLAPGADQAASAAILGGMTAVFGVGMVVGSLVTPWLSGRFSGRTLLVGALLVVTVAFVLVSRTALVPVALLAWACNGLAGGCVNVTYETMLQVGTPERLRGRVFATVESGSDGAYVVGAALVAGFGPASVPRRRCWRSGRVSWGSRVSPRSWSRATRRWRCPERRKLARLTASGIIAPWRGYSAAAAKRRTPRAWSARSSARSARGSPSLLWLYHFNPDATILGSYSAQMIHGGQLADQLGTLAIVFGGLAVVLGIIGGLGGRGAASTVLSIILGIVALSYPVLNGLHLIERHVPNPIGG